MNSNQSLRFKIASEDWEFEAIHRLNYQTFVEEIPQHARNTDGRLVDKFHSENTYAICLEGDRLVGMVCHRGQRPFSLDQKLPDLDAHLPPGRTVCEIRLLAVDKSHRYSQVCRGLLGLLASHAISVGFDSAMISGAVRQLKLYRHLGFVPFGPQVGAGDAIFQPMFLSLEAFEENSADFLITQNGVAEEKPAVNLLPGPVAVAAPVRAAFEGHPVSHRARAFMSDFQVTKRLLTEFTGAGQVEILLGSGTMANDVIAGQLSLEGQPGLILSNGEFGDRLIDQANRWGLKHDTLQLDWGRVFEPAAIRHALEQNPALKWVWAVHCETSTGILNDLAQLKQLCAGKELKLCLDCISAIGTVPVDLRGVYLASGVSGKGIAAFPGLSLVFYNHKVAPAPAKLPRYLDLGMYAANDGVPFTHSSNLLYALQAALQRGNWNKKFHDLVGTAFWLRRRLTELGYAILAPEMNASPAVLTLVLPREISARGLGWQLQKAGFLLSYRSEYLLKRNWLQICLMGEYTREDLGRLLDSLTKLDPLRPRPAWQTVETR